jgi:hypothetical protein
MAEQQPVDDPSILDQHELWRRIPPYHLVADKNEGRVRISSAAFEDDYDGDPMSTVLGSELLAAGRAPESALPPDHDDFALASITAELARRKGQAIARTPQADEPLHASVIGNKTSSVQKAFYRAARWVIRPPGYCILACNKLPPEWAAGLEPGNAYVLLEADASRQ